MGGYRQVVGDGVNHVHVSLGFRQRTGGFPQRLRWGGMQRVKRRVCREQVRQLDGRVLRGSGPGLSSSAGAAAVRLHEGDRRRPLCVRYPPAQPDPHRPVRRASRDW